MRSMSLPALLRSFPLVATATLASASTAQGAIWVVDDDGGPGVDFQQVQDAINAAADGDTVLVRDGNYADFQVVNKTLALVADSGASVVADAIDIQGLAPDGVVSLRGFESTELVIDGCEGTVWIEEHLSTGGAPAGRIQQSDDVVVIGSTFQGRSGNQWTLFLPFAVPAEGLVVTGSTVHMYDVSISGGGGGSGVQEAKNGQSGETGLVATGGFLYLSGAIAVGGGGGSGYSATILDPFSSDSCGNGGSGAPGAVLFGDAQLVQRDTIFGGGFGGSGGKVTELFTGVPVIVQQCPDGSDAVPFGFGVGSTNTEILRPHRAFTVNSPAREGETLTLSFEGEPGDLAFLFVSFGAVPFYNQPCGGSVLFDPTAFFTVATTPVDAQGLATLAVPVPVFGPQPALHLYVQANFVDTLGACNVSSGSALTLLDASL
ncbi:MAG: hypothetical protein AAF682_13275 [Planctomycetota bacterium]